MKIGDKSEKGVFNFQYGSDIGDNLTNAYHAIECMMKHDGVAPLPRNSEYYMILKNRLDILCDSENGLFAKPSAPLPYKGTIPTFGEGRTT